MGDMDPLEIGVIGSVLGGSILLLAQWFWRSPLSSIVLRFQKNEPRIAGKWRTSFKEEGQEYHESVTLRQHGRNIMADIILREDNNDETVYKFVGTFRNLVLSGTYQSTDESDFERGAILLRYIQRGTFVGQNLFFSKKSEHLVSSDYEWTRG